ncbi:MAG: NifB/NifX family molybdenum-iron cluster-binding protein [Elusimicrobiota bacterium]
MKICITSQGNNLDAQVDPRFGRCQYFIIVDSETLKFEAIENPNIGAMGGAGIQSAQMIASKGAGAVLTGNIGPNAFSTLQMAGIKIISGVSGTVKEAIALFKKGKIEPTQDATVPGHYGISSGGGMGMGRGMGVRGSTGRGRRGGGDRGGGR